MYEEPSLLLLRSSYPVTCLVWVEGFDPRTDGFESECSIITPMASLKEEREIRLLILPTSLWYLILIHYLLVPKGLSRDQGRIPTLPSHPFRSSLLL